MSAESSLFKCDLDSMIKRNFAKHIHARTRTYKHAHEVVLLVDFVGGTTKVGEIAKKEGNEVEVVWACDEKRGTLRRKEGDGNGSTRDKEDRKI